MQIVKPPFHQYIFANMEEIRYKSYSYAKRTGIAGIYIWASRCRVLGIVKEIAKGTVVQYGKRKFAAVLINGAIYVWTRAGVVLMNATRVINWAKRAHTVSAYGFECIEDTTNLAFLPMALILFGQPIPMGDENRFNLLGNSSDFFK